MKINDVRICNVPDPVGFSIDPPVFSWIVEDTNGQADWAELRIKAAGQTVYDSGKCTDADSLGWSIDMQLAPRTRYEYTLTVHADSKEEAAAEGSFETGKMSERWTAEWISPQDRSNAILRKTFTVSDADAGARLYICGLGVYEVYINGVKAGDEYLAPGYHSYDFHLAAQTYDVTGMLREGENVIEIWLGEGWFKGRLGFDGGYTDLYGDRLHAIAELYVDGELAVSTDDSWDEYTSPVEFANIYDGETFNGCKTPELIGNAVLAAPDRSETLHDRIALPVREQVRIPAAELIRTPKGDTVLDFGQNMTGWVVIEAPLPEGTSITLTAGEILQDDEFYNENYRTARAQFKYIADGTGKPVRPH